MKNKTSLSILLIGALAIAAAFGIVAYRSASAAYASQTDTASGAVVLAHGGDFGKGMGGGYTNEDLAAALGITTDELTAAYKTANAAALAQAVEAGLITQAQADELLANGTAFPFGNRWNGWLSQNGIDYEALLADALGISVEKLQAAYATAFYTRIDQAVSDGQLTQEQADLMNGRYSLSNDADFQSAMQTAYEAAVAQAVADGVITQAQADQILAEKSNMPFGGPQLGGPQLGGPHGFEGFDGVGMRGHGDPRGGFDNGNGWNLPTDPVVPVPTTAPSSGSSG